MRKHTKMRASNLPENANATIRYVRVHDDMKGRINTTQFCFFFFFEYLVAGRRSDTQN